MSHLCYGCQALLSGYQALLDVRGSCLRLFAVVALELLQPLLCA